MRTNFRRAFLVIAFLAMSGPLMAAESDDKASEFGPEWADDGRNKLALFVGGTHVDGDTGPSVGLDYEYRFSRMFGIGGTIEYSGSGIREGLIAVSLNWHVWRELKFFVAPGLKIEAEHDSESFVLRLGVEYGIDVGRGWEIAPAVMVDITNGDDAFVFGASIGRSF